MMTKLGFVDAVALIVDSETAERLWPIVEQALDEANEEGYESGADAATPEY
jgi:hypothetical protein